MMAKKDGCKPGEKMINGECWKKIGVIGIDSGQVIITDPCYIDSEWENEDMPHMIPRGKKKLPKPKHNMSYYACCDKTLTGNFGQLNYEMGHPGVAVVSSTGFGDGLYPVYARVKNYKEPGGGKRVAQILIDFMGEYEDTG